MPRPPAGRAKRGVPTRNGGNTLALRSKGWSPRGHGLAAFAHATLWLVLPREMTVDNLARLTNSLKSSQPPKAAGQVMRQTAYNPR